MGHIPKLSYPSDQFVFIGKQDQLAIRESYHISNAKMAEIDLSTKTKHVSEDGQVEYYIIQLDAGGFPTEESVALAPLLRELVSTKQYTDVVILCHGWATGREEDGSINMVNQNVRQMEARKPKNCNVLYVAVKWPSVVSTVFARSPYKNEKEFFADVMKDVKQITDESDQISKKSTVKNRKLGEASDIAQHCAKHCDEFIASEKEEKSDSLPNGVRHSLANLANKINEQSACADGDSESLLDDGERYGSMTPDSIEKLYQRTRSRNLSPRFQRGETKNEENPADEDEPTDKQFSLGRIFQRTARAFNLAATVFDVVFGTFERRASIVGSRGVHWTLVDLMKHAPESTKFHLYGHSLGSHVALAGSIGRAPGNLLPRKIHSIFITQGAIPTNSFRRGEAYRPIASKLKPIAGPITETLMKEDEALKSYDLFLPRPAGIFGFDRSSPLLLRRIELRKHSPDRPNQKVDFKKGYIYNLVADGIILDHNDTEKDEILDMFWQAASVKVDPSDYEVADPKSLPEGYWNDYGIRVERNSCLSMVGCDMF